MMESRGISNVNLKSRIKQIVVLIAVIFIGVLVSQAVQAQGKYHFKNATFTKIKYHRLMKSEKACSILAKKRHQKPKSTTFASNRKPKYRPMAEMDAPGTRRSALATAQVSNQ
jgi:hypothetical protein